MCGIIGVVGKNPVNQLLYDGLLVLQHRGQDAAGIATFEGSTFHMHKGNGMVQDVFQTRHMRSLKGNAGIAHVRYPTAGSLHCRSPAFLCKFTFWYHPWAQRQLTNSVQLTQEISARTCDISTQTPILKFCLMCWRMRSSIPRTCVLNADMVFEAVEGVHKRCRGAYAVGDDRQFRLVGIP